MTVPPPSPLMTVTLTRIYTRLSEADAPRGIEPLPKTHPRIEAYGTVDELNGRSASR